MVELTGIRPSKGEPRIVPAGRPDLDELEKVRTDRKLRVRITFDRSLPAMRFYRGLLAIVAEGLGVHPDGIHAELKFKAGFVRRILTSKEFGVAVELESAAFNQWDEARFTEFRRLAIPILFQDYLPGVRKKDVYARVEEWMGEPCPW